MTRDELKERRRQMAMKVQRGSSYKEVASALATSERTVIKACKEFGVVPHAHARKRIGPTTLQIIAELQNTDFTIAKIASNHGVTTNHVYNLARQCKSCGIKIPSHKLR